MRKRRLVILGLVAGSWLAIACSSGGGGIIAVGDGYDTPPNTREKPGAGREAPPSSVDNPNPGEQGGGAGASCPACDLKLTCIGADKKKQTINLKTDNGACSAGDGVTFDCSGHVLQNGSPIGTWAGANGAYTVNVTADGKTLSLVCTTAPTPTPTSTGTGTTPTPTTTVTSPPADAGTKG